MRGIGIFFIAIGIALPVIFDGNVVWYGAIILGVILLLKGEKRKEIKEDFGKTFQYEKQVEMLIEQKVPIKEIVTSLCEKENIDFNIAIITIFAIIDSSLNDKDDMKKSLMKEYINDNKYKCDLSIENIIDGFDFSNNVFAIDETAILHTFQPSEISFLSGRTHSIRTGIVAEDIFIPKSLINGVLILHRAYLFFFVNPYDDDGYAEFVGDSIGNKIPYVNVGITVKNLITGIGQIAKETENYFDDSKKKRLKERYTLENSFAIPLSEIKDVEIVSNINAKGESYFKITYLSENEFESIWFERSGDSYDWYEKSEWAQNWLYRIKLACLNIGKIINQYDR